MRTERKPNGYWRSLENVVLEARAAMKEHNWEFLPSDESLAQNGYGGLGIAIIKYHGGIKKIRQLLGQNVCLQKEPGYWKNKDQLIAEIKAAMKKEGWKTLPAEGVLREKGYSSFCNAVRLHGGINAVRQLLGESVIKRSNGCWKDIRFALRQAREIMKKEGWKTLPHADTLAERGYNYLVRAIYNNNYGGFHRFRRLLGEKPLEREKGFWRGRENLMRMAREIMEKEGWTTLPGQEALNEKGYGGFLGGIAKYGGLRQFREELGLKQMRRQDGLLKDLDYLINEVNAAMKKEGWQALPSSNVMLEKGYSSLVNAMQQFHGGINKFRERNGYSVLRATAGFWQNTQNAVKYTMEIMKKEGWTTLPSYSTLTKKGYTRLASAIERYLGGIYTFRRVIEKKTGVNPDKAKLEAILQRYVNEN